MTTITDTALDQTGHVADAAPARLVVDYWTVNMDGAASCDSCDATLTALEGVVDEVRPLATRLGTVIELRPRSISTWTEALQHRLVASPTVRAAGIELRPSHPDESDTRVWTWRGSATPSASPEAILDFLLQALAAHSRQIDAYLAAGGPEVYVRQYLHAVRESETTAMTVGADASCGCD